MAKKKAVDPNRKKKERMVADEAYREKILKTERKRLKAKRKKRAYREAENKRRRELQAERMKDPGYRAEENRKWCEWKRKDDTKKALFRTYLYFTYFDIIFLPNKSTK